MISAGRMRSGLRLFTILHYPAQSGESRIDRGPAWGGVFPQHAAEPFVLPRDEFSPPADERKGVPQGGWRLWSVGLR